MIMLFVAAVASQAAPAIAPPTVRPADPEKKICRSFPKLGTRLQTARTCKTAAEWRLLREDSDQFHRDANNTGPGRSG